VPETPTVGRANTLLLQGDVADDAACKAMAQAAIARWGRIDALVNNAGIATVTGELIPLDSGVHLGPAQRWLGCPAQFAYVGIR
jgi:NAD(P)-dependent dehydrogenase (short-subunit alcohol dehydrogenase family)